MSYFFDCNSNFRFDGVYDYQISEEMKLKQLNESIESGLVPDRETGVFVREGYGALVGFCPENCSTIEELLKFTLSDFNRKSVGKPTLTEKAREVMNGDLSIGPYFGYDKLVDAGYDLVLGPGCTVYGEQCGKAVYCRNYKEILNKSSRKM